MKHDDAAHARMRQVLREVAERVAPELGDDCSLLVSVLHRGSHGPTPEGSFQNAKLCIAYGTTDKGLPDTIFHLGALFETVRRDMKARS